MWRTKPMDTFLITIVIVVAFIIVGMLVRHVMRSRRIDTHVWEEPLGRNASTNVIDTAAPSKARGNTSVDSGKVHAPWLVPVSTPDTGAQQPPRSPQDVDLRRSSRIEHPVTLTVVGTNRHGESFQDKTSAVSVNLHGCRYSSHHDYPLEGWVMMQVTGTDGRNSPPVRARVRSVMSPKAPRELFQVGVELETPANVWGIPTPPEDWRRILGSSYSSTGAATAVAPALDPSPPTPKFLQRQAAAKERMAEVTVFPSPPQSSGAEDASAEKEVAAAKSEGLGLSADQLLPALQDRLQQVADRAVQKAIEERLEEFVRNALTKIDDVWKNNVRQTEEFSAAGLAKVRDQWQGELAAYGKRAEEIALHMEFLAAKTVPGMTELQNSIERIKSEIEPQFQKRLNQWLTRADNDFEKKAAQTSERHLAQLAEIAQVTAREARSQLDENIAEVRSLLATAPAGISDQHIESVVNASHGHVLDHIEKRLAEVLSQFEGEQDTARHRAGDFAQQLEALAVELRQVQSQLDLSVVEVRALHAKPNSGLSQEQFDSVMHAAQEQIFNHLEGRLNEIASRSDQQHVLTRQHAEEVAQRLENLAAESQEVRAQHVQGISDLRAQFAAASNGISQERLDGVLGAAREQLLSHLEWRLGEISGIFEQQNNAARQRSEEIVQRLEQFARDTRTQLEETRRLAEPLIREAQPQQLSVLTQSVDRAAAEFETAATRATERQLVRMLEQKQAVAREVSLELEARASETRVQLERSANSTLDEFQRRVELQMDLIINEATERIASTLASLEVGNRAACEARRRTLESEVARTAEQSTMEFRSSMKAFLYSCLVAAVSAVDEHAQTTLGGLSNVPNSSSHTIEAAADSSRNREGGTPAENTSSFTPNPRGE